MTTARIVGGRTEPGKGWVGGWGAYSQVNTKWGNFKSAPVYLCSLRGQNDPWATRGASEIYDTGGYGPPSGKEGFTVYVGLDETPYSQNELKVAEGGQWYLEWIGIEGLAEAAGDTWALDTSSLAWVGGEAPSKPQEPVKPKEPLKLQEGYYKIVSALTQKVLEVEGERANDGTRVDQWQDQDKPHQRWQLTKVDEDQGQVFYTIGHPDSLMVMEAPGPWRPGDSIVMRRYEQTGDQRHRHWRFEHVRDDVYRIVNRQSGFVIDVEHANPDGPIKQYASWDAPDDRQHWKLVPVAVTPQEPG